MLDSEAIPRIFESLVSNAISFSSKGQSIVLRTTGGGDASILEVVGQGSGVKEENIDKLFTSFFTTETDGYGLSLSSGKKLFVILAEISFTNQMKKVVLFSR